jgi:hypothetical protein
MLNRGMPQTRRLDLTRFDPEAADLDLLVDRPRNSTFPSGRKRARSPVL